MKKALLIVALALFTPLAAKANPAVMCATVATKGGPIVLPQSAGAAGATAGAPIWFPFIELAIVTAPWWINSSLIQDGAEAVGLKTYNDEGYPKQVHNFGM